MASETENVREAQVEIRIELYSYLPRAHEDYGRRGHQPAHDAWVSQLTLIAFMTCIVFNRLNYDTAPAIAEAGAVA